ncbi:MAG: MFS transporter [Alphaproteobacteria bacterium]|nr:MFS transporter [Alphaproteobacteria bacterium]
MTSDTSPEPSLFRLLRERPTLRSFIALRAADELGSQMLSVAIGWYVYAATHDPMSLAYVGLALFLPNVGLVLVAGPAADRIDRRKIIGVSLTLQALCISAFGIASAMATPSTIPVYLLLIVVGSAQSFFFPAVTATLPRLVAPEEFPRAVAAASSVFQICSLLGPAIGGLIYAASGAGTFAVIAALYVVALVPVRGLAARYDDGAGATTSPIDTSILAGIRYIRANRLLLGCMSLDLFAVLFGGVTALLPIYAKDILAVGPAGLGVLRCAPGVGAAVIGLVLAHRTIQRGAGKLMLACVASFGLATIVFAVSTNFWLSLAALVAVGGFDMVSMVIRQTLVQVATPDAMRGRVTAVNGVFIGASSELGEFESGVTAALLGTVPAALLGGVATVAIVALWTWLFPQVARAEKLADAISRTGPSAG